MLKKYKIVVAILTIGILVYLAKYAYDMNINHNFETISEGKVYKSGVIPPKEIADYVKKYHIKSIVDLRMPGTNDLVLNPEVEGELAAERKAVEKIAGLNYYSNPSEQVPNQENIDTFLQIMDDPANYPVLIHCYHGTGRAELYSAIYRIEYEGFSNDESRLSTRDWVKFSSFDIGKPKGDYLRNYQKRTKK